MFNENLENKLEPYSQGILESLQGDRPQIVH